MCVLLVVLKVVDHFAYGCASFHSQSHRKVDGEKLTRENVTDLVKNTALVDFFFPQINDML